MDTKEKVRRAPSAERRQAPPSARRRPAARPAAAASRPRTAARTSKPAQPPKPLQEVVYLPPKPFQRKRLLLRLATVAALVVAIILAMSVFFKVENIQVSGMDQYTAWDISEASGIEKGSSLFSFGIPGAAARIKKLPYVKDVRIGIKLPNTVMIEITEVRVTYAMKAQDESWWLVDSEGRIVEKAQENPKLPSTKILGVHLLNPQAGQHAVALETAKPGVDENGNTIPITITAAERLSVALDIAEFLEANGIIGAAASIDVNDMGNLQFWYGQQYQVKLGDDSQLAHKISSVKGAIDRLSTESHNSGVLDASFTVDKDGVKYTRFQ